MTLKVLTLMLVCKVALCSDYCSLEGCPSGQHTMCKYPDKLACQGDESKMHVGLTQEDRELLLDEHNKYRSDVASGKTRFPKASNMMMLHWDKEIEHIGQRWALQCTFAHDQCRRTLKDEPVGQNAAKQPVSRATFDRVEPLKNAVKGLYSEEQFMDTEGDIDVFTSVMKGPNVIGHFTQLVWATSERLGCGYIDYPEDEHWSYAHIYCDYALTGNVVGSPVYKKGEPCSECPSGTSCSKLYEGLCTAQEFDTKTVPPPDKEDEQVGKGGSEKSNNTPVLLQVFMFTLFIWIGNSNIISSR